MHHHQIDGTSLGVNVQNKANATFVIRACNSYNEIGDILKAIADEVTLNQPCAMEIIGRLLHQAAKARGEA